MIPRSWLPSSRWLPIVPVLSMVAIALGCASAGTSEASPTPAAASPLASEISFSRDIQPIFTAKCVICHRGGAAPGGLNLDQGSAYENLVDVESSESSLKRVDPGAPDRSYLLNKLMGTQAQVGGSGARMPLGASPLTQTQISVIGRWISEGAPGN